jgi:2-keto-3-deoxy-L-fuconate dehydrogenase
VDNDFAGLRTVVTGGGAGIGRATVEELAARGAQVFSLDLRHGVVPAEVHGIDLDVSDPRQVDSAAAEILSSGGVDVLVNNVGITFDGGVEAGSLDDWHRIFSVNVLSHVITTRAFLPALRESHSAAIVNLASVLGVYGFKNRVLYSATKGAVQSMSRAMASDLIGEGIRVNAVVPGVVDTPFVADVIARSVDPVAKRAQYDGLQATGRLIRPSEVAYVIANTASPRASSLVGATVFVDGGFGSII